VRSKLTLAEFNTWILHQVLFKNNTKPTYMNFKAQFS